MDSLISPKEKTYFVICVVFSVLFYLILTISVVGLIYVAIGVLIALISKGIFTGEIRGNAIRVSEKQFPEVHAITLKLAEQMQMATVPDVYILQAGGLLNAFAARFLGRNYIVLFSDILELAYNEGEPALAFIIGHELAHIQRKHLSNRWVIYPALLLPFLGSAYSRACEYTCDRISAHYQPEGAVAGLAILGAGKQLYKNVNIQDFCEHAAKEKGFWVWFSEVCSSHPNLPKRLEAVSGV